MRVRCHFPVLTVWCHFTSCDGQGVSTCNRMCVSCQMDGKDKACRRLRLRLQALVAARHRLVMGRTERPRKMREMTRTQAKTVLLVVSQANARYS